MSSTFRAFLALGAVFGVSAAVASTPDGSTPSRETVCDGETGAAYGWCTAACEAIDCGDPNQHANDRACDNLQGKFLAKTGRDLPCLPLDYACEDAGLQVPEDYSSCELQPTDNQLACTPGDGSIVYCELEAWDLYEPSSKFCKPVECGPSLSCPDFSVKFKDTTVPETCKEAPKPTELACEDSGGFLIYCDTSTGKAAPELCRPTECRISGF